MRITCMRLTVRRLMIATAMFAAALGYGLHWFRPANKYHMTAWLFAEAVRRENPTGKPVPISVGYAFGLDREGDAPPGMPVFVQARIRVVDTATGVVIDRCDFDRLLVAGVRGSVSGTFVWPAKNPGPGKYRIMRWLRAWQPVGDKKVRAGGDKVYRVSTR